jgi:hypothetical protein
MGSRLPGKITGQPSSDLANGLLQLASLSGVHVARIWRHARSCTHGIKLCTSGSGKSEERDANGENGFCEFHDDLL